MRTAQPELQIVDQRGRGQAVPTLEHAWHIFGDASTRALNNDMLVRLKVDEPEGQRVVIGHSNIIGTKTAGMKGKFVTGQGKSES